MPVSILIKLQKIETQGQVFSCKFCEISKNTFFTKQLRATASVVSGYQHVALAFPQLPGIYYQGNREYKRPCHLLKIYMAKHFILVIYLQAYNTRATENWKEEGGWIRVYTDHSFK